MFEKYTVEELKQIVDKGVEIAEPGDKLFEAEPRGLPMDYVAAVDRHAWMDQDLCLWDEEGESPSDLLGFSWILLDSLGLLRLNPVPLGPKPHGLNPG